MFQKREVRFIPNAKAADVWPRVWDWWGRQGFQLSQSGPYSMHGTSFYSRIGLRREVWLVLSDVANGVNVDLSLNAQITDEGLIAGAVSAVLFWPVAVVGGAVSYSDYETDSTNLMMAFWQFLNAISAPPGAPHPPGPEIPARCLGCGAGLLPDWKVCPYCGRAKLGAA